MDAITGTAPPGNVRGRNRSVGWRTDACREIRKIINMNNDRITGMWKQLSGALKEQWGTLTSDQSCVVAGRRERLAGRTQEQCGIMKDESRIQLRNFLHRHRHWNPTIR